MAQLVTLDHRALDWREVAAVARLCAQVANYSPITPAAKDGLSLVTGTPCRKACACKTP